jgi:transcription elongation factor GreA
MNTSPITQEGYNKLIEEYETLANIALPDSSKRIAEARAHGDLKENAEYHAALEHQRYIQNRIEYLRDKIAHSLIVKVDAANSEVIIFGSKVKTLDLDDESEEEFVLVGPAEANPSEGRISTASPIGKSLIGKKINDIVEVETPGGMITLKVLDLS